MPGILLLLARTGWCLAVPGNLPPSSCDALLEAEWEWGESRVMKTYRADIVASAPSLGDTWLHGQSPAHCLLVPQQEPSLSVIHTPHPALRTPWCQQQGEPLVLSLGPVPDGCLQEGFYRNQGQEKPAHQVWCSNVRNGRAGSRQGSDLQQGGGQHAMSWTREGVLCYTCPGMRRDFRLQHSPALLPKHHG